MKQLVKIENSHPQQLQLYCDFSNVCNYKCWYCFPDSNTGTHPWPDANIVKENLVALINKYNNSTVITEVELHFLGGEPTLWRELGDVIEHVAKNTQCKIKLFTNGSRTMRWWREYAQYFEYICLSIHHERVDIEHIIELSEMLYEQDILFETSVLMDHTNWDKCVALIDRLMATDKDWPVLAKALYLDGVSNYTEEQKEYISIQPRRKYNDPEKIKRIPQKSYRAHFDDGTVEEFKNDSYFSLNHINYFKGWKCDLGINFLYINRDGNVTGTCNQKLFGLDGYYNMYDPEFKNKFNPTFKSVVCEQHICMCAGEAALPKIKVGKGTSYSLKVIK